MESILISIIFNEIEKTNSIPIFGGLGEFILRLLFVGVHTEHESPPTELYLRLFKFVCQVKDLTGGIVCILNITTKKHFIANMLSILLIVID